MSTWLINYGAGDKTPEELGITLLGGEWRSGGPSTVRMKAARKFDAAEICAYGTQVTLKRDGSAFFVGTVRPITKSAKGKREAHDYLIEDAWADLERLTYQEAWAINQADYTGPAYSPRVILGVNSAGARISLGAQITEVLNFAIDMDVELLVGSIPTGMTLWPSEVSGMSCAEVIRTSLRYYPDWIPWLDHTTSPPTFNVTPRASATARSLSVIGAGDLQVTQMNDRVPEGVRIVYETAMMIEDEVYRTMAIDQAPPPEGDLAGPAGPGILVTHVELQGMKMQIQKQQVVTRPLPTDAATLKTYLRNKFPELAGVADASWDCILKLKAMLPDVEETIDPIDGKLVRKYTTTPGNVPRELVMGNVAEWMQRYVGRVLIEFEAFSTVAATDDEQKQIDKLPTKITVTATNAVTKTYKGICGYQAGEDVPTGIAAAYLATIQNGCNYSGSIRIKEEDVGATRWHGSKLNLTDGDSDWATMAAPIHSVVWDLRTKDVSIGFGPNPDYSIADYFEFLRLLNKRSYTDYTLGERTSSELGSGTTVSARGDTAGPVDVPETTTGGWKKTPPPFFPTLIGSVAESTLKISMIPGYLKCELMDDSSDAAVNVLVSSIPTDPTATEVGKKYWVTASESIHGIVSSAAVASGTSWPNSTAPALIGGDDQTGTAGTRIWRLCEVVADGAEAKLTIHRTGHIQHEAARKIENLIIGSPSTGEARLMKRFNRTTAAWEFRSLKGVAGVGIEEDGNQIKIKPGGDNFRVRIWHNTLYLTTDIYGYGLVEIDAGESPTQEFWILKGIWYLTEPANWVEVVGDETIPIFDVSWVIPTSGGPA